MEDLLRYCRDRAFYAYGTHRLFARRAYRLKIRRDVLTYLGVAAPITVGGVILSFGLESAYVPYIISLAAIVNVLQLAASVWAIVADWSQRHVYANSAAQNNILLFNKWDTLCKTQPSDLAYRVELLRVDDQRQEELDTAQHIGDKEKRFAMRASLLQFGLRCETCRNKVITMKPSGCDTCGNF